MAASLEDDDEKREASQALADLEAVLLRIDGLRRLSDDLRAIRALVIEGRAPRVAVVGRRGAAKSSIANALLGAEALQTGAIEDTAKAPAWLDLSHRGRKVRWIDTPGLRAGGSPERGDQVAQLLAKDPPDVLLLCVRATQVDAGIDDDLDDVRSILTAIEAKAKPKPPVLAVVTRVDDLAPPIPKNPPFFGEKKVNIEKACDVLRKHLERAGIATKAIVPVSTYLKYFADGSIAIDWRYNMDVLADAVFDALPVEAQADAAVAFEASRLLRRKVARRIVQGTSSVAFFVGAAPIPHDLLLLTPLQGVMVFGVSLLADRNSRARLVAEWSAGMGLNVGAGVALRAGARALIKLVPGFGMAISGGVAAAGTWALGMAAIRYFVDGASIDDTRKEFEAVKRAGIPKGAVAAIPDATTTASDEAEPTPTKSGD
jgi:uncharacterized protein (DUF697 family)/predicted GTPase